MRDKRELIFEIVRICHLLYEKNFVSATDGNVSARLPNGNILCTPTGVSKGMISEKHIVEVDIFGNVVAGICRPTTEIKLHLFIYSQREDVQAIVHAHPPFATGFATAGIALDEFILPEVIVNLGKIPLAKYATPSTDEVVESVRPYVENSNAILLQNHGAVTFGESLLDAYFKMEKLEHFAKILFIARLLGGERKLSEEEVKRLSEISFQSYGKKINL